MDFNPNGTADETALHAAAEDLAHAEALLVHAQAVNDSIRRQLQRTELDLERAVRLRDTARDYYHQLRVPTRQHSAISRGDDR